MKDKKNTERPVNIPALGQGVDVEARLRALTRWDRLDALDDSVMVTKGPYEGPWDQRFIEVKRGEETYLVPWELQTRMMPFMLDTFLDGMFDHRSGNDPQYRPMVKEYCLKDIVCEENAGEPLTYDRLQREAYAFYDGIIAAKTGEIWA